MSIKFLRKKSYLILAMLACMQQLCAASPDNWDSISSKSSSVRPYSAALVPKGQLRGMMEVGGAHGDLAVSAGTMLKTWMPNPTPAQIIAVGEVFKNILQQPQKTGEISSVFAAFYKDALIENNGYYYVSNQQNVTQRAVAVGYLMRIHNELSVSVPNSPRPAWIISGEDIWLNDPFFLQLRGIVRQFAAKQSNVVMSSCAIDHNNSLALYIEEKNFLKSLG